MACGRHHHCHTRVIRIVRVSNFICIIARDFLWGKAHHFGKLPFLEVNQAGHKNNMVSSDNARTTVVFQKHSSELVQEVETKET